VYTATNYQPIFKFLNEKWSKALLEDGNVRLATLYEFRCATDYKGKILDEDEGKVFVMNKSDINKTLHVLTSPNLHIYSSSQYLFSDTYSQSVEDGKDTCVMISNPIEFFKIVSKAVGFDEPIQNPCNYEGRQFPEDHIIFRSNILSLAFQKPPEYKNHREYRSVWRNVIENNVKGFSKNIPEVTPFCIKVDIDAVDTNVIKGDGVKKQIEIRVILKDESKPMILRYSRPFELFTPIIFQQDSEEEELIGFTQEARDRKYRLEYVSSFGGLGGIATVNSKNGPKIVTHFHYLKKVEKIVISTVDSPRDIPGYTSFP